MQTANAAVINAFTPGSIDYSNGADQWDGAEQAMIPKEFQNKPSNGTFMYNLNSAALFLVRYFYILK